MMILKNLSEEKILDNQFDGLTITVSLLDPANDYLQFYCKQEGDKITFTDDGYYFNAFFFDIFLNKDLEFFRNLDGLVYKNGAFILEDKAENFAKAKNFYINSLLRILKDEQEEITSFKKGKRGSGLS